MNFCVKGLNLVTFISLHLQVKFEYIEGSNCKESHETGGMNTSISFLVKVLSSTD